MLPSFEKFKIHLEAHRIYAFMYSPAEFPEWQFGFHMMTSNTTVVVEIRSMHIFWPTTCRAVSMSFNT